MPLTSTAEIAIYGEQLYPRFRANVSILDAFGDPDFIVFHMDVMFRNFFKFEHPLFPDVAPRLTISSHGGGLPFHSHGAASNLLLHGTKVWFLFPPEKIPSEDELLQTAFEFKHSEATVIIQTEGDVVHIPENYWHATLSYGESVSLAIASKPSKQK